VLLYGYVLVWASFPVSYDKNWMDSFVLETNLFFQAWFVAGTVLRDRSLSQKDAEQIAFEMKFNRSISHLTQVE
jgi:hypothetical protein